MATYNIAHVLLVLSLGVLVAAQTSTLANSHPISLCSTPPRIQNGRLGFCDGTSTLTCGVHCDDGTTLSVSCSSGTWSHKEVICNQQEVQLVNTAERITKERFELPQQDESEECVPVQPGFAWTDALKAGPRGDIQNAIDGDVTTSYSSGPAKDHPDVLNPSLWVAFGSQDKELCEVTILLDTLYIGKREGLVFTLSTFTGSGNPATGLGYTAVDSISFPRFMTSNDLTLRFQVDGSRGRALKLTVNWSALVVAEILTVRVLTAPPPIPTWSCVQTRPLAASAITSKPSRVPQLAIDGITFTQFSSGITEVGENNLRVLLSKEPLDYCRVDVLMGDNEINARKEKALALFSNPSASRWENDGRYNFHSGYVFTGGITRQSMTAGFRDLESVSSVRLNTHDKWLIVAEVSPAVAYTFDRCNRWPRGVQPNFVNANARKTIANTNTPNFVRLPASAFDLDPLSFYSSGLDVERPALFFKVSPTDAPVVVCEMTIQLAPGHLDDGKIKFEISVATATDFVSTINAERGDGYELMHVIDFADKIDATDLTIQLVGVVWPAVTHVKIQSTINRLLIADITWTYDTTGHKRPMSTLGQKLHVLETETQQNKVEEEQNLQQSSSDINNTLKKEPAKDVAAEALRADHPKVLMQQQKETLEQPLQAPFTGGPIVQARTAAADVHRKVNNKKDFPPIMRVTACLLVAGAILGLTLAFILPAQRKHDKDKQRAEKKTREGEAAVGTPASFPLEGASNGTENIVIELWNPALKPTQPVVAAPVEAPAKPAVTPEPNNFEEEKPRDGATLS
eukprot:TRINITY_DN94094_c0_g1_i1.p1 TRINITY_DN94094_c0_g1~~TRINITY_DN94094_c0_g1_i1.p1  ORF type:complete len:799 (+),score=95.33 TRINITY_DN94094_c0_g1_i1:71-2467(+)